MANFTTHLKIAALASSTLALTASGAGLIAVNDIIEFIILGTVGGLLPDIDASNSKPVRLLFTALGVIASVNILRLLHQQLPVYQIVFIAGGAFLMVRYLILALFNRLTVHRGVFHSILAALFFGLAAVCLSYYILHCKVLNAWLGGIFITLGYCVHLILDECYSVDLLNRRIKKSFGTALKLWHYKNNTGSLLMALATVALYSVSPSVQPLIHAYQRSAIPTILTDLLKIITV